jgi:molybdenum cofactor cytidylyltransferase
MASVQHPPVAAVVLAAGEASRMGASKLTLRFGESTVIGTTISAVLRAGVDSIVVVVGHHAEEVAAAMPDDVMIVENEDPTRGNASSLATALVAVPGAGAVLVVLGDMPGVDPDVMDQLVAGWRGGACVAALVRYTDGPGHPLLIDASLFGIVMSLTGERSLWELVGGLDRDVVLEVAVAGPKPVDINSVADYRRATARLD